MKPNLTSGQVAKILGVAPRTITKLCDGGKIKYWRLPTNPSKHEGDRRIALSDLGDFAREHNCRPVLEYLGTQIVAVGVPTHLYEAIPVPQHGERLLCLTLIEAGLRLRREYGNHIVVLDVAGLGRSDVLRAGKAVREALPTSRLLALVCEDEAGEGAFAFAGFDAVLVPPVTGETLARYVAGDNE